MQDILEFFPPILYNKNNFLTGVVSKLETRLAQIRAYYSIRFDQYHMDPHRHPRLEIMYVNDGECTVFVQEKSFSLKPGQFIFLGKNVYHRLEIASGSPCHVINLEFVLDSIDGISGNGKGQHGFSQEEFFSSFCSREELLAQDFVICYDCFKMGYALKDLLFELDLGGENEYALKVLFQRALIELVRCIRQNNAPSGLLYTKKAAEFVQSHFDSDISVGDVAAFVRINEAYLQTLFRKQMGCSIITYINNLRIQKAQFLLQNTSMDITDIAFAVGFNSRQHFGYMFKKACGCSPLSYRKESNRDIQILTDPFSVRK